MKLTNAIAGFDRQLAANGRSSHTRASYARDLAAFLGWLGKNPDVSTIKPDDLARFLISDAVLMTPDGQPATKTVGKPRKAISVNRTKSALRSFFGFCVESGWIKCNSARLIRSSPATAYIRHSTLSEDRGPVPRVTGAGLMQITTTEIYARVAMTD
jgi:site-specific recombinase XerD